jgi:flagellar biosynthesis/type III secretory pathway protein FliH
MSNSRYKISLDLKTLMEVEHFTDWAAEAREDGYEEGRAAGLAKAVTGIMNKFNCSAEEAMTIADVPEDLKTDVLKAVKNLQTQN